MTRLDGIVRHYDHLRRFGKIEARHDGRRVAFSGPCGGFYDVYAVPGGPAADQVTYFVHQDALLDVRELHAGQQVEFGSLRPRTLARGALHAAERS